MTVKRTSRGTKSKEIRDKEISKIADYLDLWLSDKEIMKILKIPEKTYYRYKSQIYQEDTEVLEQKRANSLAHRQIQVENALNHCIKVNKKICETSKDDKAKIEASAMIVKAAMGLLNLSLNPHYSEKIKIIARDVKAMAIPEPDNNEDNYNDIEK